MDNKNALTGPSFEPTNKPDKLVFLFHGYGDSGDNFIQIAKELYNQELNISFFAPNAPSRIPQYPLGRQWFDLYPNGINFNDGGPKEKEIFREDFLSSLRLIVKYIKAVCLKNKLTLKDCFIIGFSQGAMTCFELGNFIDEVFAGCILLSGRIILLDKNKNENFIKTPTLVIHGDKDTVLEPKYFSESCKILKKQDFLFESHLMKAEGHTISSETLKITRNFIKKYMT